MQPICLADVFDLVAGLVEIEIIGQANRFIAEDNIFSHTKDGHQHEMLMHHADTLCDTFTRAIKFDLCSIDNDLSVIRCIKAG